MTTLRSLHSAELGFGFAPYRQLVSSRCSTTDGHPQSLLAIGTNSLRRKDFRPALHEQTNRLSASPISARPKQHSRSPNRFAIRFRQAGDQVNLEFFRQRGQSLKIIPLRNRLTQSQVLLQRNALEFLSALHTCFELLCGIGPLIGETLNDQQRECQKVLGDVSWGCLR